MTRMAVSLPADSDEQGLRRVVKPVTFRPSVLLPLAYLPLLYGGLGERQFAACFGLLALNAVCLVLGQGYRRG